MCAKVKMLPTIDVWVNCTLVLIKHKYSNCIHCIKRFPLELLLEANRSTSAKRLTGQSNQYGMVFNSDRCMATSLQPGITLAGNEASGQLFESILLTLRDVVNYYMGKVLKTRLEAANSTPVSSAFFSSIDFLWPGVRLIKDLRNQGICQPSSSGFEHLATLSKRVIDQNKLEGGHHG